MFMSLCCVCRWQRSHFTDMPFPPKRWFRAGSFAEHSGYREHVPLFSSAESRVLDSEMEILPHVM